jgi:hypothetical protein
MRWVTWVVPAVVVLIAGAPLEAASPTMEQQFMAAYKAAYDTRNVNALKALLHTEGANKNAIDFYLQLMTAEFGGDIALKMENLTADDNAKINESLPGPTGAHLNLMPRPYRKLVVTITTRTATGTASWTSISYVADEGNRIRISTPAAGD